MREHELFSVDEESVRLDVFLSQKLGQTRNQIVQLIEQDAISVEGKATSKAGLKLRAGQSVSVVFPEAKSTPPQPIDFDVEVLYEDEDVLVINKPSALTVHPAPSVKEPTLVDWLKHKGVSLSTLSGEERHGIVHRLDRGTSGVMVVAKNNRAHEALSAQLQDKSMGRFYLAVITPPLKDEVTLIDRPIGRSSHNRLKMAITENGKNAKTEFRKLLPSHDGTEELIACKLYTGRTHQIRVHLESISRHIIGDHLYGSHGKSGRMERILLHAYNLYFTHPSTGKRVTFTAAPDPVMEEYLHKHFDAKELHALIDPNTIERCFSTESV
ncbi:MAG: RluA family pseudouridine synthase [Sulfuricurvum sp.]|jgi:23S rRNA pseudouridine1911/1915/1917 synthase|nr:RluA family pseudouridine synthase [Sulfuricurvum sp.]